MTQRDGHAALDWPAPPCLQQIRALEVLELIGNAQARAVVDALAQGPPEAWLTDQAKATRDRIDRGPLDYSPYMCVDNASQRMPHSARA
jgi:hypothetical protein